MKKTIKKINTSLTAHAKSLYSAVYLDFTTVPGMFVNQKYKYPKWSFGPVRIGTATFARPIYPVCQKS
jgi:hypothetical protein